MGQELLILSSSNAVGDERVFFQLGRTSKKSKSLKLHLCMVFWVFEAVYVRVQLGFLCSCASIRVLGAFCNI